MTPKIATYEIVFREFPDEVTLALNFSSCPCNCPGCHSAYLSQNIGRDCDESLLDEMIAKHPQITCVGLMGGDAYPKDIEYFAKYIKSKYNLKVGWYSGRQHTTMTMPINIKYFDYIKVGPYIQEKGGLESPDTNQVMWAKRTDYAGVTEWEDITEEFQRKAYK